MKVTKELEYLIIGAGPAGLQLGYYLERSGENYLILEGSDAPGNFFRLFPRHRTLISSNKVYTGYNEREINLRWDWNSLLSDSDAMLFKHRSKRYFPSADEFMQYLTDFAAHFELKIQYGAKVVRVTKDKHFIITDSQERAYLCRYLIVATGYSKPYFPVIPGIELTEHYSLFA